MDWANSEIITVLRFLLPGLVAAWIFYALTSYPKPSEFERIIQALIFTTIIQGITVVIFLFALDPATQLDNRLAWSSGFNDVVALSVAVLFGLFASMFANNDLIHWILRNLRITKETSFATEWFGAFAKRETYVVLHLSGQRRLYGWPEEWPNDPEKGHFSIAEAEWLEEEKRILLDGVENILVPVNEVNIVEFMSISSIEPLKKSGE